MTATAGAEPPGGPPLQPPPSKAKLPPASAVPGPDPRVGAAFALGWQMAELYRPERRRRRVAVSPNDLPGIGRLDAQSILRLGVDQLKAGVAVLADTIAHADLDAPNITALEDALMSSDDGERCPTVKKLHVDLLIVLT